MRLAQPLGPQSTRLSDGLVHLLLTVAGGWQAIALAWPLSGPERGEPHGLWQILALAILVVMLTRSHTIGQAMRRSAAFASAWLLGSTWWLYVSLHTYGGLPGWLAALAVLALAVALSFIYAALLGWHWQRMQQHTNWLQRSLSFAIAWTLAEWVRGHLATGFPWGAIGYAHIDNPLRHWAPWLGVYGVGALAAGLSAGLAEWLQARFNRRAVPASTRVSPQLRVAGVAGVLLLCAMAWWSPSRSPSEAPQTAPLRVRLLQGNVPQDLKFGAAAAQSVDDYRQALLRSPAALTVTPETSIPFIPEQWPADLWASLRPTGERAFIVGLPLRAASDPTATRPLVARYTNSALALLPQAEQDQRYDKRHLVPFGEFVPPMFQWFVQRMHIPLGDFARGAAAQQPIRWHGQRIAVNICFEDLFGEELAAQFVDPAQAPTLLLNLSNLAWFGNTVALDQHLNIARMRALELGRPMLRATNTGATAIIDARGQVIERLAYQTRGALDADIQGVDAPPTPYARWAGRWGLWPMAAVLCLLWWGLCRGRRRT